MSAAATGPSARTVHLPAALAAERRRWPGSAAARLPLLGLTAAVLQGLLYLAGSTRHGWSALTAWQILWVSFLGPLGTGLLAGLLGRRETAGRGGGAWWRPVTPRQAHVARFVVLAAYALAMQVAVLVAALPFGWVDGLSFPGPVGHLLAIALLQWCSLLALVAVAHQLALRIGLLGATALGLAWAVAGTLTAETAGWWWQPWAWSVRAMLPATGTHANGVPLEPGSPLAHATTWPALLATLVLAVAVTGMGSRPWRPRVRSGRPRGRGAGAATTARPLRLPGAWRLSGPTAALLVGLRGTPVLPLVLGSVAAVPLGLLVWPDPEHTRQLVTLLLLPVGTTLLPVLTWQTSAPAWRSLSLHPDSPRSLAARLALIDATVVVGLALWSGLVLGLDGVPWSRAVALTLLAATTGTALVWWHLWLAVRWHVGVALAAGAAGTLLALVVGGTGLADPLWFAVPWAWAGTGSATPLRLVSCTAAGILLGTALLPACRRAGARAAAVTGS